MTPTKVKRDCLFYISHCDQFREDPYCRLKDEKWERHEKAHCDDCRCYTSLDILRGFCRGALIGKWRGGSNDTNETV